MWYCSVMGRDVISGRCVVVHTFCPPSDYCVPEPCVVVGGHSFLDIHLTDLCVT